MGNSIQAHSIFTRAWILTGLELAISYTLGENRINWANLKVGILANYYSTVMKRVRIMILVTKFYHFSLPPPKVVVSPVTREQASWKIKKMAAAVIFIS